jgi:hypothetical protein
VGYTYDTKVDLYKSAMYDTLRRPRGMVGRHMARRANVFIAAAKIQVGKNTGRLAASIQVQEHKAQPYGQLMRVGSTVKHARVHHQGSRPHIIKPKQQGGVLAFRSGSRVIVTRQVMHPGTKPNRYLTDNLELFTMP